MWVLTLTVAVVGGIALSTLAGARRTASTFAAYERNVRLSDLAVNTFEPDLKRVEAIARAPGVKASATYVGLNAYPVIHGYVVRDFRYTGFFGSLDGRFFTQDRAVVVSGRLPGLAATGEIALTPAIATHLGVHVGDEVDYRFEDASAKSLGDSRYRVVGVVRLPPVIVDENDIIEGAVLPPAATRQRLDALVYAWEGISLVDGTRGIDRFLDTLRTNPAVNSLPLVTQRYDTTRVQAQQAIHPEALSLTLFGAAAGIVVVALGALGAARMIGRWSVDRLALRASGIDPRQFAVTVGLDAGIAIAVGSVLAMAIAVAVSAVWPIGPVRVIAPTTGVSFDITAVLGGGAVLMMALLGTVGVLAYRFQRRDREAPPRVHPSSLPVAMSRAGVPTPGVLGTRFAFTPDETRRSFAVRGTLAAGTAAVVATVAALVFGTSLGALVAHPARYGWTWDRMMIAEAGYGNLQPARMQALVATMPEVTAWSLVTFAPITVNGTLVPALGLDLRKGNVEPPLVAGRAVAGAREIALGTKTIEQLGLRIGDRARVASGGKSTEFTVVGTLTFPSMGQGGADHTSLGRGALISSDALTGVVAPGAECGKSQDALCPQAVIFDVTLRSSGDQVVRRIAAANPDGTVGGTYEQPVTRAAVIRNFGAMRSFPIVLASVLAIAAVLAFGVMLYGTKRARHRDLAVLQTLGFTGRQVRATLTTQSFVTLVVTLIVGVPVGVAVGRALWMHFARDIGVASSPSVPTLVLVGVGVGAVLVCSALAAVLASAGHTSIAAALRTED